ncbi:MAG: LuxR family transcriptional regulator [Nocardioides sp.]|uniref:response regulator transcription factor n=1 Tax=Nocardioides sp. TaxID=35761 RepID=UPI002630C1BE|nr:response regulator transcription factor [Nocardioides sp.]MCW2834872.1 LuxR family transcriptional regulator [Nocardioides sp.]
MLRGLGAAHHVSDLAAPGPFDIALYDTSAHPQDAHVRIGGLRDDPRVAKVAVYTWNFQPWSAGEWIRHGASGYLSKSLPAGALVSALEAIQAGRVIVAPGQQSSSSGVGWPGRDEGLTPREAEALSLIAGGFSNREVAERMTLSPNSVKSYIRTAYRKIGVNSRSQAVLWAMTNGLGSTAQRRDQAVPVSQR